MKKEEMRSNQRHVTAELCSAWTDECVRPYASLLNVQVLHVQRVVFDEFSAGFYVFAQQGGEDGLALGYVFEPYLQEGAALGIHGGFPELLGGHFSEAFVALDDVLFAAFVQDVIEEFSGRVFLDDLGLFCSARWLAGFLLGFLGFCVVGLGGAQIFVFVIAFVFVSVFLFRSVCCLCV